MEEKEKTFYKKWLFWGCITILLIAIIIGVIKYFSPNEEEVTSEIEENIYTAEELFNKIKEKNANVGRHVVYNEETDLNELLGRPNQYTSKVTFEDLRIEQTNQNLDSEYFSEEEINEPIGGTIEVFNNEEDMKKRKEYVNAISSSMSMFSEYSYGEKIYLLRLDNALTPSEAEEYEKIFYEIIK